jgi:para-nitrobenzyl esterase
MRTASAAPRSAARSIPGVAALSLGLAACSSSAGDAAAQAGAGGAAPVAQPTAVTTEQGEVDGALEGTTRRFLGIPYAAPPTGAGRFRPPQPAAKWTGPRDATKLGPACPQFASSLTGGPAKYDATTSEDCLTLDVWAPHAIASPRPVMVWIHGGGYQSGSGGEPTYEGTILSEAGDVVVVTLNYRLGPLGFAAHPALSSEDPAHAASGNYGILDQRAALAWVKKNIAAFGGDPQNVTVFGESAGAMSVCMQLVSPGSAGLYERAIAESGICPIFPLATRAAAEAQGQALAGALGCKGDDASVRACLRQKTPEEIVTALPLKKEIIFGEGVSWGPHVDGLELPDQPRAILEAKKEAKVPLLLGSNEDEGTLFVKVLGAHFPDAASLEGTFQGLFGDATAKAIAGHYHFDAAKDLDAVATQILGDAFVCDARRTARLHEAAGNPVYLYHFVHPYAVLIPGLGAFHSAELPFVWGNPYLLTNLKEDELPLSQAMQGYWTRFAAAADPNAGAPAGAVAWPRYAAAADQDLNLDLTITVDAHLRKDTCDWMDAQIE